MNDQVITRAQVDELGKVNNLKPTRHDLKGMPGYYERPKAGGGYEWGVEFKPNEGGKLTKQAEQIGELLRPFQKADVERVTRNRANTQFVGVRERNGVVREIDISIADNAARRNGWGHVWNARGVRIRRGTDGLMDFRYIGNRWEASGYRWVRGRRLHVKQHGIVLDPDGQPWRYFEGKWQSI